MLALLNILLNKTFKFQILALLLIYLTFIKLRLLNDVIRTLLPLHNAFIVRLNVCFCILRNNYNIFNHINNSIQFYFEMHRNIKRTNFEYSNRKCLFYLF